MTCQHRIGALSLIRRKRLRCQAAGSACWLAVLLLPGLLAGCGAAAHETAGSSRPLATSPAAGSDPERALRGVFQQPLLNPRVTATHGVVLVAWQTSRPGAADVRSELARIDPATGKVVARQPFVGFVNQVLEAHGSLWAATQTGSTPARQTLAKLNLATLQVARRWLIGTGGEPDWAAQVLAVAGGWLWAAGGSRLLRVSLQNGTTTAVALSGAVSSDLSSNAAGTELITAYADSGGRGAVQRRDPTTGAVRASHQVLGVVAPAVSGPAGTAVWISEPTGMMGYVQRLDATSMTPDHACPEGSASSTCVLGTSDITARLANGLLWVTQVAGGEARNYCADPVSGRKRASIRLPNPAADEVLAIAPDRVFYAAPGPKAAQYLRQMPIPSGCR